MAINPRIKQKAEDIRKKIFGTEVRESLASGIEAISEDVEATKERQITVEETMQTVIDETTGKDVISAPEIIAAHVDSNGTDHPNLKSRLDNFEVSATQQLQQTEQNLNAQLAQTDKDGFSANQFLEMPDNYLEIPSAIGSSLTTHPSIIDFQTEFGINAWNGYRYWMAHTPYPGTQNENPSIASSNDNKTWVLPEGAPNPVVPAPTAPAYNNDTELVYLDDVNILRMYYRVAGGSDGLSKLYYIESNDGSSWTTPTLIIETTFAMLSPAIIRESSTSWKMWTVESIGGIHYRTSIDGITWSEHSNVNQPWDNWSAWHIGVKKDSNGKYHMLGGTWTDVGSGEGTQYRPIVYAYSNDGITWIPNEKPQLIPTGWGGGYLYRPTFIIDESKGLKDGLPYVRVWFGAKEDSIADGWHIGYTEGYLMKGNSNPSATSEKMKRKKIGEYFKVFASNIVASFAKIARLKTKRIEVTSDFSQPLIEFRDGRPQRNGSNYMREHYHGHENSSLIRYYLTFTDDNGEKRQITYQPFNNYYSFSEPTDVQNINQLSLNELINKDGIRSYMNDTKYNRITTNTSGELELQLNARDQNKKWVFKSITGNLDANGNVLENVRYIKIKGATGISSAPNGALFEDADGKLKYKNQAGELTVLTP